MENYKKDRVIAELRSQIKTIGFHSTRAKLLKRGYPALVVLGQSLNLKIPEKKLTLAHNIVVAISGSETAIAETPIHLNINSIKCAIANKGFFTVRSKLVEKFTKLQLLAIAKQLKIIAVVEDKKVAIAHLICEAIQKQTGVNNG